MFVNKIELMAPAWYSVLQKDNIMDTILTIVYLIVFAAIFWLFFKTVNYFEKI